MISSVKPSGLVLDLQVIRPDPRVEVDGRILCEIDGQPLFRLAAAVVAAVDTAIADGRLLEEPSTTTMCVSTIVRAQISSPTSLARSGSFLPTPSRPCVRSRARASSVSVAVSAGCVPRLFGRVVEPPRTGPAYPQTLRPRRDLRAVRSDHDPDGMHRLQLRPVSRPGL